MKFQVLAVGDLPILYEILAKSKVGDLLDRNYPTHGNRKNKVTVGQTLLIWLLYILTENDHRVSYVENWVADHLEILRKLTGNSSLTSKQFSDDYLGSLLAQLSNDELWNVYEQAQNQTMIHAYDLSMDVIRVDSCNLPSYRAPQGLFQYGYSKHHRNDLPQMKIMLCSLNKGGIPLCSTTFSGECTDDKNYLPAIKIAQAQLAITGILYVGDTKMGTVDNRNYIAAKQDYYLVPLSTKYYPTEALQQGAAILAQQQGIHPVHSIYKALQEDAPTQALENRPIIAKVYELPPITVNYTKDDGTVAQYTERWIIGKSISRAEKLERKLTERLARAELDIRKRFIVKRGRKTFERIEDAEAFITKVLKKYKVTGLLKYSLKISSTKRGRKYPVICELEKDQVAIQQALQLLGVRLYATNAPVEKLTTKDIVPLYRAQYVVEQNFHHLLNKVGHLLPIWLQKQDRIIGLTRLLMLAVKKYHLIQFELRKNLQQETNKFLTNLVPGQKGRKVHRPTTKRLLAAFRTIKIIKVVDQQKVFYQVDTLNATQIDILKLLGLPPDLYTRLFISKNNARLE